MSVLKKCQNLRLLNVIGTSITQKSLDYAVKLNRNEILEIFTSVTPGKKITQPTFVQIHFK